MHEIIEPSLGIFSVEVQSEKSDLLHLSLALDYYQSNCLRMWLDMRWQSPALKNSTLLLPKSNQMLISKTVPLSQTVSPLELLKQWKVEVVRQFSLFVDNRR